MIVVQNVCGFVVGKVLEQVIGLLLDRYFIFIFIFIFILKSNAIHIGGYF